MNVLELFAGIGGIGLGLERAGMTVVGHVEIDPYCQRVLAKHWPEVPRHDDVRTSIDWWHSEPRPPVDLIVGGFPCQDISNAGRRAGIVEGTRSSLWSYMADCVRALRPRYVLVENVSALLVRGLDVVLADLAACGYDAEWDCIPASAVGAPHRRDRVWLVAYPQRDAVRQQPVPIFRGGYPAIAGSNGTTQPVADADDQGLSREPQSPAGRDTLRQPGTVRADSDGCRTTLANAGRGGGGASVANTDSQTRSSTRSPGQAIFRPEPLQRSRRRSSGEGGIWAAEPDVGRVAHGIPHRVDRLRALGNAVVPQVAEHVGRLILAADREVTA